MDEQPISRVTMFKVPSAEGRKKILDQYKVLVKTAVKDNEPYILTCEAGEAGPDPRSKGWTIVVKSSFANKADMDFYDEECVAHGELKRMAKGWVEEVLVVWYEDVLRQ